MDQMSNQGLQFGSSIDRARLREKMAVAAFGEAMMFIGSAVCVLTGAPASAEAGKAFVRVVAVSCARLAGSETNRDARFRTDF